MITAFTRGNGSRTGSRATDGYSMGVKMLATNTRECGRAKRNMAMGFSILGMATGTKGKAIGVEGKVTGHTFLRMENSEKKNIGEITQLVSI